MANVKSTLLCPNPYPIFFSYSRPGGKTKILYFTLYSIYFFILSPPKKKSLSPSLFLGVPPPGGGDPEDRGGRASWGPAGQLASSLPPAPTRDDFKA